MRRICGAAVLVLFQLVGSAAAELAGACSADSSCTDCLSRNCNPGTLFRWSGALSTGGGPNLDEPLVSDRPDFTEASTTVGRGVLQLECGYTYFQDDDGTSITRLHSWGEPLFRLGVWRDWLELRFAAFPLTEEVELAGNQQSASGMDDLLIGAKIALTPQAGIRPEMAIVPQMFVPIGSDAFTADQVLPGVNWLYGWDITEIYSVGGSTQFLRSVSDQGDSYTSWAQSMTIGYSLTERWGGYTEWFGFFPHSADDVKPEHYFDGGLTWSITNDIQWDIRAGVGLNDEADDFFCGSGLALRFH
jgi:hypothetical protein